MKGAGSTRREFAAQAAHAALGLGLVASANAAARAAGADPDSGRGPVAARIEVTSPWKRDTGKKALQIEPGRLTTVGLEPFEVRTLTS